MSISNTFVDQTSSAASSRSLEVVLPAEIVDALYQASERLGSPTGALRKALLAYYLYRYSVGEESVEELHSLVGASILRPPRQRLSFKLAESTALRLDEVARRASLSKTDTVRALISKIHQDIVIPETPRHLATLTVISEVIHA